jgi:hypothetical protein
MCSGKGSPSDAACPRTRSANVAVVPPRSFHSCVRIQPRTLLMSLVRVATSTSRAPQIDLIEPMWAVTEITRGTKHDCRFVSKDVKELIEAHNESPAHWTYGGPEDIFRGRTDPRKCAEHEHVVPHQQLREQLFAAGPDVDAIKQVLRRARGCIVSIDEHRRLEPHAKVPTLAWERYCELTMLATSQDLRCVALRAIVSVS